jgi:hypothetical protein
MTVRELRHFIMNQPDNRIVVLRGVDHGYDLMDPPCVESAEFVDGDTYLEYYDEDSRSSKDSKIVEVVVLG